MNETEKNTHARVVNSPLWRTKFATAFAEDVVAERYGSHCITGRTESWISGWCAAWTQAYITLCSALESSDYDRSMLVRWCDLAEASQWEPDTPILRRWKNRDTGRWEYAVVSRLDANGWGYDGCQFLRLD